MAPQQEEASLRLTVPEMDCERCAGTVESALEEISGVTGVETVSASGRVKVSYDPGAVEIEELVSAVESSGYEVVDPPGDDGSGGASARDGDDAEVWRSQRSIATAAGGVLLAIGLLLSVTGPGGRVVGSLLGAEITLSQALYLATVGLSGRAIVAGGYRAARSLTLGIDLLMTVAIFGAIAASLLFGEAFFVEAATITVLFSLAELLEDHAMDRARTSLRELLSLAPTEATVRRDGEEVTVPAEAVTAGETVLVRPGEKIPVDGAVVSGTSAVNQASITGESVPVDKAAGETVFAGTINETGYLEVEATSDGTDTTISRIVDLVEDAQAKRTEREQFVDRFASYYTPIVVGFALLLGAVPPLVFGEPWPTYVLYALTLLVLACPCAFVISTPVSVVSGVTSAARNGVLIKGGSHLEAVGELDAVAFDKTGTLTTGTLTVTDVIPLAGNTEEDVLRCARGLEQRSEHPIGEAIVGHASEVIEGGERDKGVENFEALSGEGVRADVDGTTHFAGRPALFADLEFDLEHVHATTDGGVVTRTATELCERNNCLDLLSNTVPALQAAGKTVVLVGKEDELEGVIALADEVRPEAAETIDRLYALGVEHTVMITGDNERTARTIAEQVGVDEYRAECLPERKVAEVESLTDTYDGVAMVGDGVNDAPALATATVGIAMGAAGSDTALETADIALLGDDLSKLPYLYELSGRSASVIRQNIWASLGLKALLVLGVPFGLVPIWLAVLVGDAGMTTAVTANAMRLSGVDPDTSA